MGKRQRRRDRESPPAEAIVAPTLEEGAAFEAGGYRYEVVELPPLPEQDQAVAVRGIAALGAERLRLLRDLDRVDEDLRPRVQGAIAVGVPYRRIAELTGYSRSTLSRWSRPGQTDS
jgi:DNA-directed RNA polymerase specialized sigma24 family protein